MRGVYVAKHKVYPNTYKIGFSGDICKRLVSLSTAFKKEDNLELHSWFYMNSWHTFYRRDLQELEGKIHRELAEFRCGNKELFCIGDIENALQNVYDELKFKYSKFLGWSKLDGMPKRVAIFAEELKVNYSFQDEIVQMGVKELTENNKFSIFIPTGCGKTHIAKKICDIVIKGKILVLTPQIMINEEFNEVFGVSDNVIVQTYQMVSKNGIDFTSFKISEEILPELIIYDEAHHLVHSAEWSKLQELKSYKKMYLTATPHIKSITNDEEEYELKDCGNAYTLELETCIEKKYLADFRILCYDKEEFTSIKSALKLLIEVYARKCIVVYSNSTENAKAEYENCKDLCECYYLDASVPKDERIEILNKMRNIDGQNKIVLFNVNIMNEGVSVNTIDCVLFAENRQSVIGLKQNIGRALRKHPGKNYSIVVVNVEMADTLCEIINSMYIGANKLKNRFYYEGKDVKKAKEILQLYNDEIKLIEIDRKGGSFNYKMNLVLEFEKKFGRPVRYNEIYKNVKIGKFISHKMTDHKKGILSKEKLEILKSTLTFKERIKDKFVEKINLILEFEQLHNDRIVCSTIYNGVNLGRFLGGCMENYKKNDLSEDRIKLLKTTKSFNFLLENTNEIKFAQWIDLCIEYENDGNEISRGTIYKDKKLGLFISNCLTNYRKGLLSEHQIDELNQIRYFVRRVENYTKRNVEIDETEFNNKLELCLVYENDTNGVIKSKTIFESVSIGQFINIQIKAYNKNLLSNYRLNELKKLRTFNNRINKRDTFAEKIQLCIEYEQKHDNILSKTKFCDTNIGMFLNDQLNYYRKNQLPQDRIDKLMQLRTFRTRLNL